MKSLKAIDAPLSHADQQLKILSEPYEEEEFVPFAEKLDESGLFPLTATGIDILQVNVGKMCNQTCNHCHVDAGPDRREIMTRDTMQYCLDALSRSNIKTVDLTGGAPEMNPDFSWFVEQIRSLGRKVIVRCNLTIIVANKSYYDLPEFFKKHNVEVVSSLPYFAAAKTDAQRGEGVFAKSIRALKMLNDVGYGIEGSGLILNLVYNPSGAFLPGDQHALQHDFKQQLAENYEVVFNELFAITNLPISRFLEYLIRTDNYAEYMDKLISSYNPAAAANVMCRNTISVGWDGYLYDCDFNQMLELSTAGNAPKHIREFDVSKLDKREIVINQHCFGCTAGAGSSCGGSII